MSNTTMLVAKEFTFDSNYYYETDGIQLSTDSMKIQAFWVEDLLFIRSGYVQMIYFDESFESLIRKEYMILFDRNEMSFFELVEGGYAAPELEVIDWSQFVALINDHLKKYNEEVSWIWL
jgi:hypothetical protein